MKDAKDQRIRSMSYFFKVGAVVLRYGLDDLKRELGKYPGNTRSKNDLVDALSMQRKLRNWKMNKTEVTEGTELEAYKKKFRSYNFGFKRELDSSYVSY